MITETEKHTYWMRQALLQAKIAESKGEVPVGAVIVCDDKQIASGYNKPILMQDPTAHAEIMALRSAGASLGNYRLPSCTLYVTIEPCAMCAGALIHARIKQLIVGATDIKAGACGSILSVLNHPKLNHQIQYQQGILAKECRQIIQGFFQKRR